MTMLSQENTCDITISSIDDLSDLGNVDNTTICFEGVMFDAYELTNKQFGENVTLRINSNSVVRTRNLSFGNNLTIINDGTFVYGGGTSINLSSGSKVTNMGTMSIILNLNGGEIINNGDFSLVKYSNLNSGDILNKSGMLTLDSNGNSIGSNISIVSPSDIIFNNTYTNNGYIEIDGNSTFNNKFTNNNEFITSGDVLFKGGFVSNSNSSISTFENFFESQGDVILYNGEIIAGEGFLSQELLMENQSLIQFGGDIEIGKITLRGVLESIGGCNQIIYDNITNGFGGTLKANSPNSIVINDFPRNWTVIGNVGETCLSNESCVVYWNGEQSSDINNKKNWTNNSGNSHLNNGNCVLVIPNSNDVDNNPIFSGTSRFKSFVIEQGGEAIITGVIDVNGFIDNKGNINGEQGEVFTDSFITIYGNGILNIGDISGTGFDLESGSVNLYNSLSVSNESNVINGTFTFKSNESNTAFISDDSNSLIGKVTTERYIPDSNRAFRYINSSVDTHESIRENLQEGVNNTINNYANNKNPNPGFGTHITGSKSGSNGFDASLTGNPSMFLWDNINDEWRDIENTDVDKLRVDTSFSLLIRGDRSTNIYVSNDTYEGVTTLRMTGDLRNDDLDLSNKLNDGINSFSFIGNPFQSKVDVRPLLNESNGVKKTHYYAYSPQLQDLGAYITVSIDESGNVETTPQMPNQDDYKFIQIHQAIFIENTSDDVPRNLTFKNEYRSNGSGINNEVFSLNEPDEQIIVNLFSKETGKLIDGIRVKFNDNYSNDVNDSDLTKLWNRQESMSTYKDENWISVDKRNLLNELTEIELYTGLYEGIQYEFLINVDIREGKDVILLDTYTDDEHHLNNGENKITFGSNGRTDAYRFKFIIEKSGTLSDDDSFELSEDVVMYPNPVTSNYTYIKMNDMNDASVHVYDMNGNLLNVGVDKTSNNELRLSTNTLSSGIYLVKVISNGISTTKKLVVR